MRNLHPLNWIQWLTVALAICIGVTVPILYFRLSSVQRSIQEERRNSILSSCLDQNRRHDETLAQLNEAGRKANEKFDKQHPNDPAAQAAHDKQTAAGVATFRLIFNASTPHRNCSVLAARYVKTPK